jgi:1,4-alpha-glucan branching enzyme
VAGFRQEPSRALPADLARRPGIASTSPTIPIPTCRRSAISTCTCSSAGNHRHAYNILGANCREVDGVAGVLFAVWAPNAERVSVVGDFNRWDGRRHQMRVRPGSGVWEMFIPDHAPGAFYRFEIRNRNSGEYC